MTQITPDEIYSGFWEIMMNEPDRNGLLRKIQADALTQLLRLRGVEAFIAARSEEEMALIVQRPEQFARAGIGKKNRGILKRHAYARLIADKFKLLSHGIGENGTSATQEPHRGYPRRAGQSFQALSSTCRQLKPIPRLRLFFLVTAQLLAAVLTIASQFPTV